MLFMAHGMCKLSAALGGLMIFTTHGMCMLFAARHATSYCLVMDVPQAWYKLTAFIAGCFGFLISAARNYIVVHLSSPFVGRKLF